MTYFSDLDFRIVNRRIILYGNLKPFYPESNSIEFIRTGQIMLEKDGKEISLLAPALFWMRQGQTCRFFFPEKTAEILEHIYFDFIGSRSERLLDWLEEACPAGCLTPRDPEKVSGIFYEMLKLYRNDSQANHAELVVGVEKLAAHIKASLAPEKKPLEDPYGIWQSAEKIRNDPFLHFDFHAMAAKAGITYDHYRRLFRGAHKMSPSAYVRDQRMFRAAELLRVTNLRIKEIVYSCNFDSLMDFSRSFRKYSGMSPRAYRKMHAKQ